MYIQIGLDGGVDATEACVLVTASLDRHKSELNQRKCRMIAWSRLSESCELIVTWCVDWHSHVECCRGHYSYLNRWLIMK